MSLFHDDGLNRYIPPAPMPLYERHEVSPKLTECHLTPLTRVLTVLRFDGGGLLLVKGEVGQLGLPHGLVGFTTNIEKQVEEIFRENTNFSTSPAGWVKKVVTCIEDASNIVCAAYHNLPSSYTEHFQGNDRVVIVHSEEELSGWHIDRQHEPIIRELLTT